MLKKLNQFINGTIMLSIVFLIMGVIFLIYPKISIDIVTYIISFIFIVNGIYLMVFKFNIRSILFPIDTFISGILSLLLGLIIVIYKDVFYLIIPIILGIYFICSSIFNFRLSFILRSIDNTYWILSFIMTIIKIIIGFILIINPTESSVTLIMLAGSIMIIYAISDIIDMIIFKKNINDIVKVLK